MRDAVVRDAVCALRIPHSAFRIPRQPGQAMLRAVTRSWRTGGPGAGVGAAACGAAGAAALRDSARSASARARVWADTLGDDSSSSLVGAAADTASPDRAPASGPSTIDPE